MKHDNNETQDDKLKTSLIAKIILNLTKLFVLKKKLTLLTLIYIGCYIGYQTGSKSNQHEIINSKREILNFKRELEIVPKLNLSLQEKSKELQMITHELEEQKTDFKKHLEESNLLKDTVNSLNQKILEDDQKQQHLLNTLKQSNEKIKYLEIKLTDGKVLISNSKRDLLKNEKYFNQLLNQKHKEIEILQDKNKNEKIKLDIKISKIQELTSKLSEQYKNFKALQKELETSTSKLSSLQEQLNEQIKKNEQQNYDKNIFQTEINNKQEIIEDLKQQLNHKEDQLNLNIKELHDIKEQLSKVSDHLDSLESQRHVQRILLILDKILSPILRRQ